jgi:hypothetical protein
MICLHQLGGTAGPVIGSRDMSQETLKVYETFRVWNINRVEPRESNSRPVFGRVLF